VPLYLTRLSSLISAIKITQAYALGISYSFCTTKLLSFVAMPNISAPPGSARTTIS